MPRDSRYLSGTGESNHRKYENHDRYGGVDHKRNVASGEVRLISVYAGAVCLLVGHCGVR